MILGAKVFHKDLGKGRLSLICPDGLRGIFVFGSREVEFPLDAPCLTEVQKSLKVRLPRVIWTDKITGELRYARQDFADHLPQLLKSGVENIKLVRTILEEMGEDYSQDKKGKKFARDSRQIRFARAYLVSEKAVPIVSVQSHKGGYYLANDPAELKENAEELRKRARGLLRSADDLDTIASMIEEK